MEWLDEGDGVRFERRGEAGLNPPQNGEGALSPMAFEEKALILKIRR